MSRVMPALSVLSLCACTSFQTPHLPLDAGVLDAATSDAERSDLADASTDAMTSECVVTWDLTAREPQLSFTDQCPAVDFDLTTECLPGAVVARPFVGASIPVSWPSLQPIPLASLDGYWAFGYSAFARMSLRDDAVMALLNSAPAATGAVGSYASVIEASLGNLDNVADLTIGLDYVMPSSPTDTALLPHIDEDTRVLFGVRASHAVVSEMSASIFGRVVDCQGVPLRNIAVGVLSRRADSGMPLRGVPGSGVTYGRVVEGDARVRPAQSSDTPLTDASGSFVFATTVSPLVLSTEVRLVAYARGDNDALPRMVACKNIALVGDAALVVTLTPGAGGSSCD